MPDSDTLHDQWTEAALHAYRKGWTPVRVYPDGKRPYGRGWENTAYADESEIVEAFTTPLDGHDRWNVGVLLGKPSRGLIDIDIDDADTRVLANMSDILPATGLQSGRSGAPRSHRWYRVKGTLPSTTALKGDGGPNDVLVELRSTGAQTVLPPSIHPKTGDVYTWDTDAENKPAVVDASTLVTQVHVLALMALLQRHWPGEGGRHACYMALAGGLLMTRSGRPHPLWVEMGETLLHGVAAITNDEEGDARPTNVSTTVDAIRNGQPVQGWPTLAEHLGEPAVHAIRKIVWGLETAAGYEKVRGANSLPEEPGTLPTPDRKREEFKRQLEEARRIEQAGEDDDDEDDENDDSLAARYPDASPVLRRILSLAPDGYTLPETAWGVTTNATVAPDTLSSPPSLGHRSDGVPMLTPGTMSLIFGPPKSGKTFVTFALIADVLRRGGKVLLIDWENGYPEIYDRLIRMGLTEDERSRCETLFPSSTRLESVGDRFDPGEPGINDVVLVKTLLDVEPDLVVVDALSNLLGRHGMSPNDAAGIERVEGLLRDVLPATGAAVLLVDHTGHSTTDRAAGSFRKSAMVTGVVLAVEAEIKMGRETRGVSHVRLIEERSGWLRQLVGEGNEHDDVAAIVVDDTVPGDRTDVALTPPQPRENLVMTIPTAAGEKPTPKRVTDDDVREVLAELLEDHPDGMSPTALMRQTHARAEGASRRQVEAVIDAALASGELISEDNPGARGQRVRAA